MTTVASRKMVDVWVQALACNDAIAIPASQILEMVTLDNTVSTPIAASEVRGMVNLRGRVVTLLDLRVILGRQSATIELGELCEMLVQRKIDHELWLDALEVSLKESVPFTKARDPTKCAFGQWYSAFQADNAVLRMQLAKLDGPHRAVHLLADETLGLARAGKEKEALECLSRARRSILKELMRLLDESIEVLRDEHQEIVLVLDRPGPAVGILVDSVVGVRRIEASCVENVQAGTLGEIEDSLLGLSKLDGRLHLLLDLERTIENRCSSIAPGVREASRAPGADRAS